MKNILALVLFSYCIGLPLNAQESIILTKHNLSVSGVGTVIASTETDICIFCHSVHNTAPFGPLWNRNNSGYTYKLYKSTTTKAVIGQPSGSSILCLSCHDGTIALGSVLNRSSTISFANSVVGMPVGVSNLSTDLRNDHPISFAYDVTLTTLNGNLKNPASLDPKIHLENGQLQCTSCHDPHKNPYEDFLVVSTKNSGLCISCHEVPNWTTNIHNTSSKTWNSTIPNPWPYTPWTTVAENGCENCHNPHNSGDTTKLLQYLPEENNCFNCHSGNVADNTKSIKTQIDKTYRHNVYGYTAVHNSNENTNPVTKHVECVDCHNSHATKSQTASAPLVKGANFSVLGIKQDGTDANPATYEYEICYRCHSGNAVTAVATPRKIVQNNLRLMFDPATSPSFHPVAAVGNNTTIAGLISPLTASSRIYCSDCHASNDTTVKGPHGSIYPQILKFNYDRTDASLTTYFAYELCYQCHNQATTSTNHKKLSPSQTHDALTSCNTCHDPHGISSAGNTTNNSFLINFNTNIVTTNGGLLNWTVGGTPGTGTCTLTCHAHVHNASAY